MTPLQNLPLAKLIPSATNVCKTGRNEGIGEFAASIKAHGPLQNLTVPEGSGDNKDKFEVIAGGRRLAASAHPVIRCPFFSMSNNHWSGSQTFGPAVAGTSYTAPTDYYGTTILFTSASVIQVTASTVCRGLRDRN